MSGILIKKRILDLQLRSIDLIKAINERKLPYKSSQDGTLHVNQGEMSTALSDLGTTPKFKAILEAADKILSEMEDEREKAQAKAKTKKKGTA